LCVVCVCMCVCVHVCVCMCVCVCAYVWNDMIVARASDFSNFERPARGVLRACVCACVYVSVWAFVFACVCATCMCVYECAWCVSVSVSICVRVSVCDVCVWVCVCICQNGAYSMHWTTAHLHQHCSNNMWYICDTHIHMYIHIAMISRYIYTQCVAAFAMSMYVLQCVAVCCSVLQWVRCNEHICARTHFKFMFYAYIYIYI